MMEALEEAATKQYDEMQMERAKQPKCRSQESLMVDGEGTMEENARRYKHIRKADGRCPFPYQSVIQFKERASSLGSRVKSRDVIQYKQLPFTRIFHHYVHNMYHNVLTALWLL
jgi:hypothetical protein